VNTVNKWTSAVKVAAWVAMLAASAAILLQQHRLRSELGAIHAKLDEASWELDRIRGRVDDVQDRAEQLEELEKDNANALYRQVRELLFAVESIESK
jgi:hypothetical protein